MSAPLHAHTVVVGAGATGALVARRLREDPRRSLLVLEAGSAEGLGDWGYAHRPARGAAERPYPRHKGAGPRPQGLALRAPAGTFDAWAAMGLPEWRFEACLPSFRALEHDLDFGGPYHGADGPLQIARTPERARTPWHAAFLEACDELGSPRAPDANDPRATGHGPAPLGAPPALGALARPTLRVLGGAEVLRLRFEGARVIGVEAVIDDRLVSIDASLVVLCAGVIGTPLLLMRSGIGPAEALQRLGVRARVDAPGVGRRLHSHPRAGLLLLPREGLLRPGDPSLDVLLRYRSAGGRHANDMLLWPERAFAEGALPLLRLVATVGDARGAGRLHFRFVAWGAAPQIDAGVLDDPDDLDRAVDALELGADLLAGRALAGLVRPIPPQRLRSRRALKVLARAQQSAGPHAAGTAPMGPERDPYAVADSLGRVRGVEGLVLADASLMPTTTTPSALGALMVAERVASALDAHVGRPLERKSR